MPTHLRTSYYDGMQSRTCFRQRRTASNVIPSPRTTSRANPETANPASEQREGRCRLWKGDKSPRCRTAFELDVQALTYDVTSGSS